LDYDYPGNIRELKSIIQSTVNLAQGMPISTNYLPDYLQKRKSISKRKPASKSGSIVPLAQVEKLHILKVYYEMGKNKSQTARILGIGLNTLRRKIRSYGVK
jgi:transcriptional regulator with PAS, ATPase and Fis domain